MPTDAVWWQMPGPRRYLQGVIDALRDGENVVLCLPEHLPAGLHRALRAALGEDGFWIWEVLDATPPDQSPAGLLFNRFVTDAAPDELRNARTLISHESFAGHIVWLDGIHEGNWPAWKSFLSDYQHACQSRPLLDRTLFCVPLIGQTALDPPTREVCLSHHTWRGQVQPLDMLLFASHLIQEKRLSPLKQRLAAFLTANVSQWDPHVCERLAAEDLAVMLRPHPVLQEIARDREWEPNRDPPAWQRGMCDELDGHERIHPAALWGSAGHSELARRLWSAETSVLLPFVEEKRRELLEELAGLLRVPFTTRFRQVISDVRDLEIGHIEAQITQYRLPVDPATRLLVRRLREIRNCLAHLEPLPASFLDEPGSPV